jgi:hypothetical protein
MGFQTPVITGTETAGAIAGVGFGPRGIHVPILSSAYSLEQLAHWSCMLNKLVNRFSPIEGAPHMVEQSSTVLEPRNQHTLEYADQGIVLR